MVLSWSRLLLWVMSDSMIQKQTGCVLMFVTPGATVGWLESRRPPETMLVSKDLAAAWGMLIWVASSSIFFFEIYSQMCAGPSLIDLSFIIHRVRTCKEARKALWYGNLATHFLLNLTPLHIICSCEKSPIKQANFLSSKSAWCGFVGNASFIFETHGRKASGIEGTVNLCWCLFILLFLEMI